MHPTTASRALNPRLTRAISRALLSATLLGGAGLALPGHAEQNSDIQVARDYAIAPGPLGRALSSIALDAGISLSFDPALTEGLSSPGLKGRFSALAGLQKLLSGSALELVPHDDGSYSLRKVSAAELPATNVSADSEFAAGTYGGEQIARAGRLGILGEREIIDVPFSVAAFTDTFVKDIQARSVAEVLKYSVGVTTAQNGDNSQADILYFRGFKSSTGEGAFDGLPGLMNRQVPLEPFARIEAQLGSSAFLNGRPGNVGGTLNMIPKRAEAEPLTRMGLEYVSDSIFGSTADIGRRFGEDNAFGARINLAYQDGETSVEPSARRSDTGSLGLDYQGETVRLYLDYIGNERAQQTGSAQGISLANGVPIPDAPDASKLFTQPWGRYTRDYNLLVGRAEWDFAEDWTLSVAHGRARDEERQLSYSETLTNANGALSIGNVGYSHAKWQYESSEVLLRTRFDTAGIGHRLTFGGNQYGSQGWSAFTSTPVSIISNLYEPVEAPKTPGQYLPLPPHKTSETTTTGYFVSDEISLFDDRLLLLLGARNTDIETVAYNGYSGVRSSRYADDAWTPAYGVVFKALPWLSLYANKVEALEEGAIAPNTALNRGELFPPTKAKQKEIGAKADFGRYGLALALYEIERASLFTDPVTRYYVMDGLQKNRGVELSVYGEVLAGLRVYSGVSKVDAVTERTSTTANNGNTARGIPEYSFTASLDWDVPGVPGLAVQTGLVRTGEQSYDANNQRVLQAWTRYDAGMRYSTRLAGHATTLRLNVENLTDKDYWASADRGTLYLGAPRTVAVSASVDF